jgi:dTDP-D-glucose 4,6-dehydratase
VKATTRLDWRPAYNWEQALKATVDWFKEYQRQGGGSTSAPATVDMYEFCCQQIQQYMNSASAQGIKWVNP